MKKVINKIHIFFIFIHIIFYTFIVNSSELREIQETDRVLGNLDAPITMIEYASMSCPHCAEFHINTLPKINDFEYGSSKKLTSRIFDYNIKNFYMTDSISRSSKKPI